MTIDFSFFQRTLAQHRVRFEPGLSDQEVDQIEHFYRLRFPPDYRDFLQQGLPVSFEFIDWRNAEAETIWQRLHAPRQCLGWYVEADRFWLPTWGQRPADLTAALAIADQAYTQAPQLIPILAHRYIPNYLNRAGNPIFSVFSTDTIFYGSDLINYLLNEFAVEFYGIRGYGLAMNWPIAYIPLWTDVEGHYNNYRYHQPSNPTTTESEE